MEKHTECRCTCKPFCNCGSLSSVRAVCLYLFPARCGHSALTFLMRLCGNTSEQRDVKGKEALQVIAYVHTSRILNCYLQRCTKVWTENEISYFGTFYLSHLIHDVTKFPTIGGHSDRGKKKIQRVFWQKKV